VAAGALAQCQSVSLLHAGEDAAATGSCHAPDSAV